MKRKDFDPKRFPPFAIAFYEVAIDEEARLAVRSFLEFSESLADEPDELVAAGLLHEALNHCAAISRYFWPSASAGPLGVHRASLLRELYSVADTSPLNNRRLRNSLEHFDERIDRWVARDPVGPIVASPVIASHTIVDSGFGHAFKVIDTESDMYVVLGEKFAFGPLAREVSRIFLKGADTEELPA